MSAKLRAFSDKFTRSDPWSMRKLQVKGSSLVHDGTLYFTFCDPIDEGLFPPPLHPSLFLSVFLSRKSLRRPTMQGNDEDDENYQWPLNKGTLFHVHLAASKISFFDLQVSSYYCAVEQLKSY